MKTQSFAHVFSSIWEWCRSLTGMLTILVIILAIGIIALTVIGEYYSKTSLQYRITRIIFIAGYIIFGINFANNLIAHILAAKWLVNTVAVLFAILITRAAIKRKDMLFIWLAAGIGGFILPQTFGEVGLIHLAFIIAGCLQFFALFANPKSNNSPITADQTLTQPRSRPPKEIFSRRVIWQRTKPLTQTTAPTGNPGSTIIDNIIQESDQVLQRIN